MLNILYESFKILEMMHKYDKKPKTPCWPVRVNTAENRRAILVNSHKENRKNEIKKPQVVFGYNFTKKSVDLSDYR